MFSEPGTLLGRRRVETAWCCIAIVLWPVRSRFVTELGAATPSPCSSEWRSPGSG
jgi:hypothetical protein